MFLRFPAPICLLLFCVTRALNGQQTDLRSPQEQLLVISPQAKIMAGETQLGTLLRGTLITSNKSQGPWRYIPDQKGWVHERDVLRLDRAVAQLTREIAAKPTAEAYHLRGIAWMSQQEWLKGAQDLEKAFELGDSAVSLHYNLGQCYLELGKVAEALDEFSAIIKTYPDESAAYIARGNLHLQNGDFPSALADFDKAASQQPKLADIHNLRGVTLRMMGRFEDALAAYNTAIEVNPKLADALANRAYIHKQLKNLKKAKEDYEAALQLAPDDAPIRNDFAWLLATGPDEAVRDPQRAVELAEAVCNETENRNGEYLDTLAAAYASTGRFDAAAEAAKLSLQALGDQPSAKEVRERLKLYESGQAFVEE